MLQVLMMSHSQFKVGQEQLQRWLEYTVWDLETGDKVFQVENRISQDNTLFLGLLAFGREDKTKGD